LHHVREVLDEVFGSENFCQIIGFRKTGGQSSTLLASISDYLLMYAKDVGRLKYRSLFTNKVPGQEGATNYTWIEEGDGIRRPLTAAEKTTWELPRGAKVLQPYPMFSDGESSQDKPFDWQGETYRPAPNNHWKTTADGLRRLSSANRLVAQGKTLRFVNYLSDYPVTPLTNYWADTQISGYGDAKLYVVQTLPKVVARALLMSTDPGDLVLDPTCGSGTTAYVAEQWGRRWLTIDTSRVPLALARQRLLTATFPYYELKEPKRGPAGGFVYKRKQNRKGEEIGGLVPHITLKSIAQDEPPATETLVDRPEDIGAVTRVSGPFVVEATIAPVQMLEDSTGGERPSGDPATHIERMTEVLRQSKTLRLPGNRELVLSGIRRTVDSEYLHAEAKEGDKRIAITFGPQDGAISSSQVFEAVREAYFLKYDQIYFFGFAIEANARSMIEGEKKLRMPAVYVAVTPDVAMSDLLKTTRASEIFSITGLPDFEIRKAKKKGAEVPVLYEVELKGLDIFDPESLDTESTDANDVPCWMVDTDYDGMSFYATQVFFPKTSAWDNLQKSLKATFDESVWDHLGGTTSEPFAIGAKRRIAVKVIDERGNELLRIKDVEA
jgi:adenine-specific DNA-methyltransferase